MLPIIATAYAAQVLLGLLLVRYEYKHHHATAKECRANFMFAAIPLFGGIVAGYEGAKHVFNYLVDTGGPLHWLFPDRAEKQ